MLCWLLWLACQRLLSPRHCSTHSIVSLLVMKKSETSEFLIRERWMFLWLPWDLDFESRLQASWPPTRFALQAGKTNSLPLSGGWSGFSGTFQNTVFLLSVSLSVSWAFWNSLKESIWEGGVGILSVLVLLFGTQTPCWLSAFHTTVPLKLLLPLPCMQKMV